MRRSLLLVWCLLLFGALRTAAGREEGISHASHNMLIAAERGETQRVIDYLTINGVPLNTKNNFGVSAIIFAANNGNVDLVQALVGIGAKIEDRSNNWRTPLLCASYWGHYDCVQYLTSVGANIAATDIEGMTPLMAATKNGNIEVVQLLLDRGADPLAKNVFNGTAMTIAQIQRNTDMISILQPYFVEEDTETNPYTIMRRIIWRELGILFTVSLAEAGRLYASLLAFREDFSTVYYPGLCEKAQQLQADLYPTLVNLPTQIQKEYVPWMLHTAAEWQTLLAAKSNELYPVLIAEMESWRAIVEPYTGPLTAPGPAAKQAVDAGGTCGEGEASCQSGHGSG
eukprot:CAMPEP_0173314196 /NCGR_PEP_ID=MMETSP1143-20121109/25191_1 /TAXON_ID=483371 /ORGANISM="non described non described, Strain CCMP2298" /LENGTH=341 /DNA_ID=CAMNT_0014256751 /DNA_START=114 /DNA_END=1136 /DNA_ORIENTATION=-